MNAVYVSFVSKLFTDEDHGKYEGIKCTYFSKEKSQDTFRSLFGPIELRKLAPVQLTLFNRTDEEIKKINAVRPRSVSPLTGHVLGHEGFQVVEAPRRKGSEENIDIG